MKRGFTIVELLIVIVVIAILAAISVVAYGGFQNRANDAAVQADLTNIGRKILAFSATEGSLPDSGAKYTSLQLAVSRNAYGNHYTPVGSNGYNMAYCYDNTSNKFVVVAASKSGNVFVFRDGATRTGVGPMRTITGICTDNGLTVTTTYSWFFSDGSWQAWIN